MRGCGIVALVIVAAYAFFGSLLLYKITDLISPLRVKDEQEAIGLDLSQHGETAVPIVPRGAMLGGGA